MIVRRIPGLHWLRLDLTRRAEPGHGWMYRGLVRRDTFTVHGYGLVVMALPRKARIRP